MSTPKQVLKKTPEIALEAFKEFFAPLVQLGQFIKKRLKKAA